MYRCKNTSAANDRNSSKVLLLFFSIKRLKVQVSFHRGSLFIYNFLFQTLVSPFNIDAPLTLVASPKQTSR